MAGNQKEKEEKSVRLNIPSCYKIGLEGLCKGEFVNNYWSLKKCRFCPLFPVSWCGNCKFVRWHGPHMACHHPKLFGARPAGKWISRKDVAWITRKKDAIYNPHHGCEYYERANL